MNEGSKITPVKNPELNRVQEETKMVLETLSETVNQLVARLSKVMSPSRPEANNEKANPKYCSELAQDIDSYNSHIWSVIWLLREAMERLEI